MSQTNDLTLTLAPVTGRVVGLAIAPLHRFSKSARESLALLEGLGIEGDVHAGAFVRHRYLARRQPGMPNLRQVHLIPSELLETLKDEEVGAGDLGENILTAGLDLEALEAKGHRDDIGDVRLVVDDEDADGFFAHACHCRGRKLGIS